MPIPTKAVYDALQDVAEAAISIDADLSGNADSRIRGGYLLVEEDRVRWLMQAVRKLECARFDPTSRIELPHEMLMIEGIASQMRANAAAGGPTRWWHHLAEKERERWRAKARNHIEQLGWK